MCTDAFPRSGPTTSPGRPAVTKHSVIVYMNRCHRWEWLLENAAVDVEFQMNSSLYHNLPGNDDRMLAHTTFYDGTNISVAVNLFIISDYTCISMLTGYYWEQHIIFAISKVSELTIIMMRRVDKYSPSNGSNLSGAVVIV